MILTNHTKIYLGRSEAYEKNHKFFILILFLLALLISIIILILKSETRNVCRGTTVDKDAAIASAEESASLLSETEYECIDEIGRRYGTYCENINCTYQKNLYKFGFDPPDFMEVNNEVIGISFVYEEMFPEDYKYNRFHVDCGVCYIYDEYIDNIPRPEVGVYHDVDIVYARQIEGNIYCYVGTRFF